MRGILLSKLAHLVFGVKLSTLATKSQALTSSLGTYDRTNLKLCKSKNNITSEYALRNMSKPMGVRI